MSEDIGPILLDGVNARTHVTRLRVRLNRAHGRSCPARSWIAPWIATGGFELLSREGNWLAKAKDLRQWRHADVWLYFTCAANYKFGDQCCHAECLVNGYELGRFIPADGMRRMRRARRSKETR